jgi:GMP synthase (glutamine-hydrolysing)
LLLIQAGTPPEDIRAVTGDLPQWFLAAIEQPSTAVQVVRVFEGEPLPAPGLHRAAIITGSWSMVTDLHPWSEMTASWIRLAMAQNMPLLGVCYPRWPPKFPHVWPPQTPPPELIGHRG